MKNISYCFFLLGVMQILACAREPNVTTRSPKALRLYDDGVRLFEQFYFSEAKAKFDSALVQDSTFAMAWARLAILNFHTRDEQSAQRHISTALKHSAGITKREQLFVRLWDHEIRFDDVGAAIIADSLISACPEEAEAYLLRGALYEANKNLDSALTLYKTAASVDTGYAKAFMMLGYAFSTKGDQEKAAEYMQKYIRLSPNLADPRASFADLLLRVGRYDEALDHYQRSLELKTDYWYSFNQIGQIYSLLGRLSEAEEQFDRGLALLPPSRQIEAARMTVSANLNLQRGKAEEARGEFAKALTVDSTSLEAAYGYVSALAKLGRFQDSHRVMERIEQELQRRNLTESQVMVGFHLMRARVLTEEGRFDEATSACDKALEYTTPISRGAVFRQLAEIFLKTGDHESAFASCEEALLLNPNSPSALLTLARVYRAIGDRRMTQEIGMRLLELWKHADADFQDLSELRRILGMPSVRS